jgi:hypothetical protein
MKSIPARKNPEAMSCKKAPETTDGLTWNHLKQEREAVAPRGFDNPRSIGDIEHNDDAKHDHELFHDEKSTANIGRRDLRDIDRRSAGKHAAV